MSLLDSVCIVERGTDLLCAPGPVDRAGGCHLARGFTGSLSTSVTVLEVPDEPSVGGVVTDVYP